MKLHAEPRIPAGAGLIGRLTEITARLDRLDELEAEEWIQSLGKNRIWKPLTKSKIWNVFSQSKVADMVTEYMAQSYASCTVGA